jgi:hypothetical protein
MTAFSLGGFCSIWTSLGPALGSRCNPEDVWDGVNEVAGAAAQRAAKAIAAAGITNNAT